jgi:hypothetical protein
MKKKYLFILIMFFHYLPGLRAQSQFSLTPGIFYNGGGFYDEVKGFGVIIGVEYMKSPRHFFSIELRTRFGYYGFDDGTKWTENNKGELTPPKNPDKAKIEYSLFSPQIGVVPKLYYHVDESLPFFLENEFSFGLMAGNFKYNDQSYTKKSFTEPVFSYVVGVGAEYKYKKYALSGSVGYSTLNFRSKIRKNKPQDYTIEVPNQSAGLMVNVIFKIPL